MKERTQVQKLKLEKESIRRLTQRELLQVAGREYILSGTTGTDPQIEGCGGGTWLPCWVETVA